MATIKIAAAPATDIWRKPPVTNIFNAPTKPPPAGIPPSGSLPTFVSARISFSLSWSEQYDQGGLLLSFRQKGPDPATAEQPPQKWIKTGIEFYNGAPRVSTVACDDWADWSVAPLTPPTAGPGDWVTVLVERDGDENGTSLWIYQVLADGTKLPLREVCWVYPPGEAKEWELSVDAFAARPAKEVKEDLVVEFKDFEVKWQES